MTSGSPPPVPVPTPPLDAVPNPLASGPEQWERAWWSALILHAVETLRQEMAQEFTDLQAAVAAIGGEGGEITQAKDAVLAAIAALQTLNGGMQTQLAMAQDALTAAQADLAAGRQVAAGSVATLDTTKTAFDTAEQQLNDAAAALTPPPGPAPAP